MSTTIPQRWLLVFVPTNQGHIQVRPRAHSLDLHLGFGYTLVVSNCGWMTIMYNPFHVPYQMHGIYPWLTYADFPSLSRLTTCSKIVTMIININVELKQDK